MPWWRTHCQAPAPILVSADRLRVYCGCWDAQGISRIGYVDLDANDPRVVLGFSESPVLDIGEPGTFDENGLVPMGVGLVAGQVFLYYTGFQLGHKVRYYMFAGLGISQDGGASFKRASRAPVLDRSEEGLCTRGGPTIIVEDNKVKMWYAAGTEWAEVGGKPRPTYSIYYLESPDGIEAGKRGHLCIAYDPRSEHGLGRPQVSKVGQVYKMFHTRRTIDMKYSIGYAESPDGRHWTRKDSELGLTHSDGGWDSEMIYFPYLIQVGKEYYLFYNGNNFGGTGLGCARLKEW